MYLLDTNVVSELRKGARANAGVTRFVERIDGEDAPTYISVNALESWLQSLLDDYADQILEFGIEEAQVWGRLRVPQPENALDKQIAATALTCGLTLVTRNLRDFAATGAPLLNPFEERPA